MKQPSENLKAILRSVQQRGPAPAWLGPLSERVMQSVRSDAGRVQTRLWLLGAAWAGAAAVAALCVMLAGGFLDLGLGVVWFGDPLGLASMSLFGA